MKADPKSGLAVALYASILGLDIALHPDQAMTLGMESFSAMARAVSLEPENPRVHLLQGQSLLYVPEAFGGGAAAAIGSLEKAVGLFQKEKPSEAGIPSWGLDETYAYLGLAHAKTDPAKARGFFEKALSVNPAMGLARSELAKLAKRP
jgi:tetratricopeptide (TPR) repeat protein